MRWYVPDDIEGQLIYKASTQGFYLLSSPSNSINTFIIKMCSHWDFYLKSEIILLINKVVMFKHHQRWADI